MRSSEFENVKSIDGSLWDEEIRFLYEKASKVEDNCILEIGNY